VRKEKLAQKVEHMIDRRPDVGEIRSRTTIIRPGDVVSPLPSQQSQSQQPSSSSSSSQQQQEEEEEQPPTVAEALRQKIDQRPDRADLIRAHILPATDDSTP
jgi:hypothetical protein